MGGGDLGALAVLAGEIGQLIELLDEAGITVTGLLTRAGVAAAIRGGYDPWGHRHANASSTTPAHADPGIAPHTATPAARDEHWGRLRSRRRAALHAVGRPSGRGSTSARCSCSRC